MYVEEKKLIDRWHELEESLTGNFMEDLDVKEEQHKIMMKLNGVKPEDSSVDCENCGS